ncbi:hypothetical protein BH11PAT2_BH11PAT2_08780 [soil metagenome]
MKTTLALAALFLLVLGGGYLLNGKNNLPAPTAQTAQTNLGTYTQAEVATHDTTNNCWATINGNVYNLTSWIAQHPGGEAPILGLCGKDGTSAFDGQHSTGGQANAELATFKIGTITP